MLAENPVLTTSRFISAWQTANVSCERLSEEIRSVANETHRFEDNFSLKVRNGELIDPATDKIINFSRNSPLEIAEGKVWDSLKAWANTNEEGVAIWTSPKLEGIYPCDKVVYYQLAYTFEFPPQKVLLSTAILLDNPKNHFEESLREKLTIKNSNYTLTSLLEELGENKKEESKAPSQEIISYFIDEIKSGKSAELIAKEMKNHGIVGNYSISCPTLSGRALLYGSNILNFLKKDHNWKWIDGDCIRCGEKNTKIGPCKICKKCNDELDKKELAA